MVGWYKFRNPLRTMCVWVMHAPYWPEVETGAGCGRAVGVMFPLGRSNSIHKTDMIIILITIIHNFKLLLYWTFLDYSVCVDTTNIYYVCFSVYYCKTLINIYIGLKLLINHMIWNLWIYSINSINRNIYSLNNSIFVCSSISF